MSSSRFYHVVYQGIGSRVVVYRVDTAAAWYYHVYTVVHGFTMDTRSVTMVKSVVLL